MVLIDEMTMRFPTFFRWLTIAAIAVAVTLWFHERRVAAEMAARLAAVREQQQQLAGLRATRDRLQEELRALAVGAKPGVASNAPTGEESEESRSDWKVGAWSPAATWRNEGRATPQTTIATLLWAASGGDLAAVQSVLEFDASTRAKAQAWFDALPPETRALYATPEDLVASVTVKGIATTSAQLSWFNQMDPDHAIVGVMLAAPKIPGVESAPHFVPASGNLPPTLTHSNPSRIVALNLRRAPDGWRISIPSDAIERMARKTPPK